MNVQLHAAEILEKAADIIESEGWTTEYFVRTDDDGNVVGYCAVGAIKAAATGERGTRVANMCFDTMGTQAARQALLDAVVPLGGTTVPHWNDEIAASGAEVADTMKRVAKDIRNQTGDNSE